MSKAPSVAQEMGLQRAMKVPPAVTRDRSPYWLYLLECEGGSFYAGIAIDVEQRFIQHVLGRGARYTRANPPLRVAAAREYPDKGAALSAEFTLKQLPRAEKLGFFTPAETAERYRMPEPHTRERGG
jgi:putative endonuclease